MAGSTFVETNELTKFANELLYNLKNSHSVWEDVITKSGKLHLALKAAIHASSTFFNAMQQIADISAKTSGGSKEVGACLARLCISQRTFDMQMKSMSNHLLSTLATPLTSELEEWRRTLTQLEKDRNRHTKRARLDLKKALSEYHRCQKKVNRYGISESAGLGLGVGHGKASMAGAKALAVAYQAATALHEVHRKTEALRVAEKSAIRNFMLEDRRRFCFFASCLMPILECQISMLRDMSVLEEIFQSLSKISSDPNKLLDNAESTLQHLDGFELAERHGAPETPHCNSDCLKIVPTLAGSKWTNQAGSSDGDSGRLTMETTPRDEKVIQDSDLCSLASSHFHQDSIKTGVSIPPIRDESHISVSGLSSHSNTSSNGNAHYVRASNPLTQINYEAVDSHRITASKRTSSVHCPTDSLLSCLDKTLCDCHSDVEEPQHPTLRRAVPCRTSSATFRSPRCFSSAAGSSLCMSFSDVSQYPDPTRPVVDPEWLRQLDSTDDDDEDDDTGTDPNVDTKGDFIPVECNVQCNASIATQNEVARECIQMRKNIVNHGPEPVVTDVRDFQQNDCPVNCLSNRHTITLVCARDSISNVSSSNTLASSTPPISKGSDADIGMVLYPNQALPPPVYTNLNQLVDAAKRKSSLGTRLPDFTPVIGQSVDRNKPTNASPVTQRLSPVRSTAHSMTTLVNKSARCPNPLRRFSVNNATNTDSYSEKLDILDHLTCTDTARSALTSSNTVETQMLSVTTNSTTATNRPGSVSDMGVELGTVRTPAGFVGASPTHQSPGLPLSEPDTVPPSVGSVDNIHSHPPPPSIWQEDPEITASLMYTLSHQLQQLTQCTQGNSISNFPPDNEDVDDGFDLPPPPSPTSMFSS